MKINNSSSANTSVTRRDFIKSAVVTAGIGIAGSSLTKDAIAADADPAAAADEVVLSLLDNKPLYMDSGVSFGVPWPRGLVRKGEGFSLSSPVKRLPLQSWPLAYWPDGSVKWMGF